VLPHGLIRDPYFVNQFDLLLIGGGGLFSHPHPPLNDIEWQKCITPPVVIIGVGADESVIAQSEVIIRKALFVSGRDEPSVKALSTLRGDIRFCPDPVIADPSLRANRNENPRPITSQAKTLWILKASPETQFASLRERIDADRDSVCFLEPSQEYSLLMDYPAAQAIYSSSELVQLIDEAQNVVSMRYHGCILSMMRGRPVMGVREDKSRQLLSRYGNTIYFTPVFDNFELPDFSNFIPTHQALDRDRSIVLQELTYALNAALLLK
jgi:polysaccharide pyruvyl transferase WcaK-like protein